MRERDEHTRHFADTRGLAALWFAILAGPAAWFAALNVNYSLVRLVCSGGSAGWIHLASALALAVAVAAGVVGWREWRRAGGGWPGDGGGPEARARFMAVIGILSGGLFSVAIIALWAAKLFFDPCSGI